MAKLTNEITVDVGDFVKGLTLAEKRTIELGEELRALEKQKLGDGFKQFNTQAGIANKRVSELENALKSALASGDSGAIDGLLADLNKAKAEADEFAASAARIDEEFKKLTGTVEESTASTGGFFAGLQEKVGGLGKIGEAASGGLGGVLSALPIPQLAAAGAAITAVGAAIGTVVAAGREANEALKNLQVQTGLTGADLEKLEDQASIAFQKGLGENVAESITLIGEFRNRLQGVVPDDFLGEAAARTDALAKSLGVETPALLTGAAQIAKQFGISYDDALNQVAAASQSGVADVEGLLDTFNEFSANAAEAGISADGFRSMLQKAADAGIKDLAKIGDGVKELNNRIKSGDLAAGVAQVAGPIGETLQGITQLAEQGVITAEEAARQSVAAIEEARAAGEINEATRGELFTLFGGSIAEDLGSDLYAKVYGAPLPTDEITAQADKAGQLIDQRLAQQDPIQKLERAFTDTITDIGKGLVSFYEEFVAPIINPIVDGFLRIKQAVSDALGGDALGEFSGIFETLQQIITNVIDVALNPFITAIELVFGAISDLFAEFADATKPVREAFTNLAGEGDNVGGIFDTIRNVTSALAKVIKTVLTVAIKVLLLPLRATFAVVGGLINLASDLIDGVVSTAKAVRDWALSFDFVREAIAGVAEFVTDLSNKIGGLVSSIGSALGLVEEGSEASADAAKSAADNTKAWQAAVTGLIKANQLNDDAIKALADKYEVAEDVIRDFANANRAAILTAAGDVNQLADNFNNALAAAQANVTKYLAAVAGGAKQFTAEARKAQAQARALEAAQDRAAFAIDPVRQKQVAQQRAAAAAETLRVQRELTAGLIADARERETELLRIQQEAAAKTLEEQIALQKAVISAGGAGGPEAQAALAELLEQQKQLVLTQERERVTLEGQFAEERLNNLISAEQRARDAVAAINEQTLTILERQFASFDLTGDTLAKIIDARTKQITSAAEAEVRGLVESLPQFTKGLEAIFAQVQAGLINEDQAKEQIDALRRTIEEGLLAGELPGADLIAQQIKAIRDGAALASSDAARETARAFRDAGIAQTRSDIIRGIEEQVAALEDQRDILLQNLDLTQEQRAEIEQGFAKAIDKVRTGELRGFQDTIVGISGALREFKVELDAEDAAEQANQLAEQAEAINDALRAGEITYQEALDRLAQLEAASVDTQSVIAQAATQALQQVAASTQAQATASLDYFNQVQADIVKVSNDTTLTAEQRNNQLDALNNKLEQSTSDVYAKVGAAAAGAFASAVVSGENAFKSLVLVALDSLQALVPVLTAQIFGINAASPNPANVATFGAAGLAAAAATTAILQGLVAAARAAVSGGFKEGGYTGNGGVNEVAGVVHGREFVVNARATSKYRDVLEAMNSGRPLDLIAKEKSGTFVDINGGLSTVASIMADVRDRLDRIPDQALMKQQMGVDIALDDRLYERQRFRKQVRGLR